MADASIVKHGISEEVNIANVTMCKGRGKSKNVQAAMESRLSRMEEIVAKMVERLEEDVPSNDVIEARKECLMATESFIELQRRESTRTNESRSDFEKGGGENHEGLKRTSSFSSKSDSKKGEKGGWNKNTSKDVAKSKGEITCFLCDGPHFFRECSKKNTFT
ncbi:hypothetical protein Droror1_Dr00009988, partial [Drosera rotundifolia]